jgi:GNAT superfamily N-acetyltransferase
MKIEIENGGIENRFPAWAWRVLYNYVLGLSAINLCMINCGSVLCIYFNESAGDLAVTIPPVITESIPTPSDLQFLEDRLYEFNAAQTGQDDGQLFSFFIRNDQQEIVAGLAGWIWAYACQIQSLWVHPSWRRQGYGYSLLKAAEDKARDCRCRVILIASYSFQAPWFYKKYGYDLAWQLNDFPPGHQHFYFIKRFTD